MHPTRYEALERLEPRHLLATINWDGGGGDNLWHNPLNWDGDVLPGPADAAVIDLPGSDPLIKYTTGFTQIAELRSRENLRFWGGELLVTELGRNHGTLTISGGTLRIRGPWKQLGEFRMTGGALRGAGDFIPTGGGEWSGGRTTGSGRFQLIAAGLGLTLSGDVLISRRFVVDAPLVWPSGTITLTRWGRFHLLPGQSLAMTPATEFTGQGGVYNNGIIAATGGRVSCWFYSAGPASAIQLPAGEWTVAGGVIRSPATLDASATLRVDGPDSWPLKLKLRNGMTLAGGGRVAIGNALVEVYAIGLTFARLRIDGTSDKAGIDFFTGATIDDAVMTGGRITIENAAVVRITSAFDVTGGGFGSAWNDGRLVIHPGATCTILDMGGAGGLLVVNYGDMLIDNATSAGWLRLLTHQPVTKRGGGELYFSLISGPLIVEAGTVIVTGVIPYAGSMTIAAGTVASFRGPGGLAATGSITGPGRVNLGHEPGNNPPMVVDGTIDVGVLRVATRVEVRAATLHADSASFSWWGGLTIGPGSDVEIGHCTTGGYGLHFLLAGAAPGQFGSTVIGTCLVWGVLGVEFAAGFVPQIGAVFDLVLFGTLEMPPSTLTVVGLPPGLAGEFTNLADRIRLTITPG